MNYRGEEGVAKPMKIKRLNPPSLEEVRETIATLEKEFHTSSKEFANNDSVYRRVPDDVAADWDLALRQLDKLSAVTVRVEAVRYGAVQYWKTASGPQCDSTCDTNDRRQYQDAVAA